MTTPSNPFEIAREALRMLAARRIAPTPDNYLTLYHEIAGTKPPTSGVSENQMRALASALPRSSPDQLRLARQLDEAVKAGNWDSYQRNLAEFITGLAETQRLEWSTLIGELLRQWDAKHPGLTSARKREALEHVLAASSNPDLLFTRLQGLLRSWGQGRQTESTNNDEAENFNSGQKFDSPVSDVQILPELRELFAFTLETAIATQLIERPQLAADAKALARDIRIADSNEQLKEFLTKLKRFAFKLELLAEDQEQLRTSLLKLLRLLVENATELVLEDNWLHGQIAVVKDIIDKPLSQSMLDDAERRLKEVIFKQSQLKVGLFEARNAIKQLLAGFVDHLSQFTEATSDYHDKIERCSVKISAANNITELENVIDEVMRETRHIQLSAKQSRNELRQAQEQVNEAESRIRLLEAELASTSDMMRHDQLTGALNRRGLDEMFARESARSQRHETPLCVALLDIDNFKKLNDSMGHATGDQALVHLATVCRDTLRPQDTVARYGGEEFIILLPDTSLEAAVAALTRLQRELTKRFFLHENEKVLITFSAGVTVLRQEDDQKSVLERADGAMYQAKQTGKNRVVTG